MKLGGLALTLLLPYLEVEMGHIVGVQMLDPQQDLLDEVARLLFRQSLSLRDKVKQLPATQPGESKSTSVIESLVATPKFET
jgi:hypothetical protein